MRQGLVTRPVDAVVRDEPVVDEPHERVGQFGRTGSLGPVQLLGQTGK